jgi:hypothetical protein
MSEIVSIYGVSGARIADIRPDIRSVTWRLNKEGRAVFLVPYTDDQCTTWNLRPGNFVLIEFSNGLPDWSGVMDYPLERDANGVTVNAYSGEHLLDWRISGSDWQFHDMTPGAIFSQMITSANAERPTGITIGNVYARAPALSQRWNYYNLLQRVQELARLSYQDFNIDHRIVGGALQFLGNWYQRRGTDKSGRVLLEDGCNVESPHLLEQGPVANVVTLVGNGAEWATRPVGVAIDRDSASVYGYRQYVEQVATDSQTTLDSMALALLEQMVEPRKSISMTASNTAPARFADYNIGDIVSARLFTRGGRDWAFDAPVRVVARSWMPDGTCDLEVTEWGD